jgi:putative transposase
VLSTTGRTLADVARMARVVVPGVPHHITQRGNRRLPTFFRDSDYALYKRLMAGRCRAHGVAVWAYCLMPNHVHLIVVPPTEQSLRAAIGEAHRRYTLIVNRRQGWRGCLWQGRFFSFPLDAGHLYNGVRYVEQNPVRAGLVAHPADWPHSSARAHLLRRNDVLARWRPLGERFTDWQAVLGQPLSDQLMDELRHHERTGRPLGSEHFLTALEGSLDRRLRPRRAGRRLAQGHSLPT